MSDTTIERTSKIQLGLVGGLLAAAVWVGGLIMQIDRRQTRMEERAIATQTLMAERMGRVADDMRDVRELVKSGLEDGNEARASLGMRVSELENEVHGLSRRVTDLEKKQ